MAKSDGPEREIWGTWEELLLACAVNRHGTQNWDSVAMEVQRRSTFSHLLAAHSCKQRYHDLQRRFAAKAHEIDGGDAKDGHESKAIPWLEELRKLRVAELRREVQRYDVSIVSLQLKVKRLKEERERSLRENEAGEGAPEPDEIKEEKREGESPPENVVVRRNSGDDAGRSSNESNSTDPNDGREAGSEDGKPEGVAGNDAGKPDPITGCEEKVAGEGSYNGSSETIPKAAAAPAPLPEAVESGESVAESKREAAKESSDVQSSASLSRRRRGRRKAAASGGSSGADEPQADEVSPVSEGNVVKSQPLVAFLEIIWCHEYGSIFQRRLESQESVAYKSLIRQHMDLDMIRTKREEEAYTSVEFSRDLLLLCNNAIVFFPKNSPESTAAHHLRGLINKEISTYIQKPDPSPSPQAEGRASPTPSPPQPTPPKPKPDPDLAKSLLDKPCPAPPLIACRKRSSISAKAATAAVAAKEEREEKPDVDKKEVEITEGKRTKERSVVSGARGLRTSKGRGSSTGGGVVKSSSPNQNPNPGPHTTSRENDMETAKAERKTSTSNNPATASITVAKRGSAATLLNRMKRSSSSNSGTLLERLKSSGAGGGPRGGGEQKKLGKGEARKLQGLRQGSSGSTSGRQVQERNAPVKRSVGRPPKRPVTPLPAPPAKRVREEVSPLPPPPRAAAKKRGRR